MADEALLVQWREARQQAMASSETLRSLCSRRAVGSSASLSRPLSTASFIPAAVSQMRLQTQLDGARWPEPSARERKVARWLVFALNMAVLWSYQSLLSAQALYEAQWPGSRLSFLGTAACTSAMACGQLLALATGVGARARFSTRLIGGFLAFAAIGAGLLARPSATAIVLAFAGTGLLNCVTESPLYALAAQCWPDGELTAALNAGNGAAGAANVAILACVRLALAARSSEGEALARANSAFLCLMVAVSLSAVGLSCALLRLPTIRARARARLLVAWTDGGGGLRALLGAPLATIGVESAPYRVVWPLVRLAACCQLAVLALSLLLWPGIACARLPASWTDAGLGSWWCSPAVIGAFNLSDLGGRLLASSAIVARALPLKRCAQLAAVRALLILPLALPSGSGVGALLAVCALGLSNGLLATRTMCIGPELVPEEARGVAAGVMVLALYCGIALGAMSGLLASELLSL